MSPTTRRPTRCLAGTAVVLAAMALVVARPTPASADGNEAPGAPAASRSITAGDRHSCALLDDGTVKCWGGNTSGQLGYGDTQNRGDSSGEMGDQLPAVDLGTGRTATAVTAGAAHTCALLDDATVTCWGSNFIGQLGYGDTDDRGDGADEMGDQLPTVDLGTGRTATDVTAGQAHTCALLDDATVKCWGTGFYGALGYGDTGDRGDGADEMGDQLPTVDLGTGRTATAVTAGGNHTCALLDDATVKCWGLSAAGQLGYVGTDSRGDGPGEMGDALPVVVGSATAVTAGAGHTCALHTFGAVTCWGGNTNGQLGRGSTVNGLPAGVDLGTGRTATAVSAGGRHTCALLDDATLKCWGYNAYSQLGQGDSQARGDGPGEMGDALEPIGSRTAVTVTTGADHSCAVLTDATAVCWGWNEYGNAGQGRVGPIGLGSVDDVEPIALGSGRSVTPVPGVEVDLSATQTEVVAGHDIDYEVTVTNTGGVTLTGIEVTASAVPNCAQDVPDLAPTETATVACTHTTSASDVPEKANQVGVTTEQGPTGLSPTVTVDVVDRHQPDAKIRRGTGPTLGNDVYDTVTGQTRTGTVANQGTVTFAVPVENDGTAVDDVIVQGLGSTARFTVGYRQGTTNITASVVNGSHTIDDLAPGTSRIITVTIRARAGTPVGSAITRTVVVTTPDSAERDRVRAMVTRR